VELYDEAKRLSYFGKSTKQAKVEAYAASGGYTSRGDEKLPLKNMNLAIERERFAQKVLDNHVASAKAGTAVPGDAEFASSRAAEAQAVANQARVDALAAAEAAGQKYLAQLNSGSTKVEATDTSPAQADQAGLPAEAVESVDPVIRTRRRSTMFDRLNSVAGDGPTSIRDAVREQGRR
jgi:hypothetical protein